MSLYLFSAALDARTGTENVIGVELKKYFTLSMLRKEIKASHPPYEAINAGRINVYVLSNYVDMGGRIAVDPGIILQYGGEIKKITNHNIASYFPGGIADEDQHKIHLVTSLDMAEISWSSPVQRLLSHEDPLHRFWLENWGFQLPPNVTHLPQFLSLPKCPYNPTWLGLQGDVIPGNPTINASLDARPDVNYLIRAEYVRMYEFVEGHSSTARLQKPPIIIIMGQPGIGKTIWMHYAIRRRLGEKKSTILYRQGRYYSFTNSGVSTKDCSDQFRTQVGAENVLWCFVDSADSPDGLPTALSGHGLPGILPIYISSPTESRWSNCQQSRHVYLAVMNPWTWEEIEAAHSVCTPKSNLTLIKSLYHELGPTARICFEYDSNQIGAFKKKRQDAINHLVSVRSSVVGLSHALISMLETDHKVNGVNNSLFSGIEPSESHKVWLMWREQPEISSRWVMSPMSKHVAEMVVLHLEEQGEIDMLRFWDLLNEVPVGGSLAGNVFEAYVHRIFRRQIHLSVCEMFSTSSRYHALFPAYHGKSRLSATRKSFLQGQDISSFTSELNILPKRAKVFRGAILDQESDTYFQSQKENQVGIDSLIVFDGYLLLFQFTVSSTHSLNPELFAFLKKITWLPPLENWRVIFVIPAQTETFNCPAPPKAYSSLRLFTAQIDMKVTT
ncbi:hypothetical protein AMATHDRAFT_6767 [Amanita thiersii Skay4041]|uniref:Crinkler (CRN) family protein n=1 Tax=Amanita thiersii Skay4041 TaxID=703135 RepID=A0A2A9N959_9AGAR|nr:hypothetical protein AMATHDRAFT_6767 [Amanita thiersii Skay4041]